eukprot:TRINITY_DN7903_c0_g1_i1.p1 TRINITY_DN7903_c0_g1~~TRINITY_DN7903_c0_g1_i1.p1  ORF type:complete len:270 (+),score=78.61 TRINITY_DN7903_c0_g1_i1:54-863(+)
MLPGSSVSRVCLPRFAAARAMSSRALAVDWGARGVPEVTPEAAVDYLKDGGAGLVLDVREEREWNDVRLEGENVLYVPMGNLMEAECTEDLTDLGLPAKLGGADSPCLVLCKKGVRSHTVAHHLRGLGKTHVANIAGGIHDAPYGLNWESTPTIDADHLAVVLRKSPTGHVLDVREPNETAHASLDIDRVVYVPMSQLSTAATPADLERFGIAPSFGTAADPMYVSCMSGKRSARMGALLKALGKTHVANLRGGLSHAEPYLPVRVSTA